MDLGSLMKDSEIGQKMHQFFIKKFLEQNYKKKLKSEMIMQEILDIRGPKAHKKKNFLYNEYWKEKVKEQKESGGGGMNVVDLLKNVCRNMKDEQDNREKEDEIKKLQEEEYESKRNALKNPLQILNSTTFDDLVNKITHEYKKKQEQL